MSCGGLSPSSPVPGTSTRASTLPGAKILENGELLALSLDKAPGSGFQSRKEYMFGKVDMQLKRVSGNSAGTLTAYYLSSKGSKWDEIDFEFLGNLSSDPDILHTNAFSRSSICGLSPLPTSTPTPSSSGTRIASCKY